MKKPLALVCLSYSATLFLTNFLGFTQSLWILVPLVIVGEAALLRKKTKTAAVMLSCIAAVCCFCLYTYFSYFPAQKLQGENLQITGTVTQPVTASATSKVCTLRLQSVDGKKTNFSVRLYGWSLPDVQVGDAVSFTGNLSVLTGEKGYIRWALSDSIYLCAYLPSKAQFEVTGKSAPWYARYTHGLRDFLSARLTKTFRPETATFMKAVLLGDVSGLSVWENDKYSKSGISHAFSVSGMHVAFLAAFVMGLFMLIGVPRRYVGIPVMLVLLFFAAMLDFAPPVTRAVVMAAVVFAAQLSARQADTLTSLSLAAAVILTVNPYAASDVGLQLSFAAVLGIVLFAAKWKNAIQKSLSSMRCPHILAGTLSASLSMSAAASVFTSPILLVVFGRMSLLSPLTNLLCLPAIALLFYLGIIAALLPLPPLLFCVGLIADVLTKYTALIAASIADWKIASITADSRILYITAVFAVYLYLLGRRYPKMNRAVAILSVMALLFVGIATDRKKSEVLTFTAIDVGQGEALVLIKDNRAIVVDCGTASNKNAAFEVGKYLNKYGINGIDAVILTHSHVDHISGVAELMENFPVKRLYIGRDAPSSALGKEAISAAVQAGTIIKYADRDSSFLFADEVEISLYTSPADGVDYTDEDNHNDMSLMVFVDFNNSEILLTGDSPELSEKKLVMLGNFDAEILKAAHHGSKYSSCEEFLAEVTPTAAVISVGKNSYGLPAAEAIDRIGRYTPYIYKTIDSGTVEFTTAGDGQFKVRTLRTA